MRTIKKIEEIKRIIKEEETNIDDREDLDLLFHKLEAEGITSYAVCLRSDTSEEDNWLQTEYFSNKLDKTIIYDYSARDSFDNIDELINYILEVENEIKEFEEKIMFNEIERVKKEIYSIEYDSLSDYGKGIRDFLNYMNKEEEITEEDIIKFIIK